MAPVDANTAPPYTSIAVKRSANDGDGNPHAEQSKLAATSQEGLDGGEDALTAVISDEGKEAGAEDDHGGVSAPATHVVKKMKQSEGLPVDINKAVRDDGVARPYAGAGGGDVPPGLRRRLLEIKKRGVEIEERMLELERRRLRWAEACRKVDTELEKMRVENGRLRVENERLWMRLLKSREREPGVGKSKRKRGRDGAAEMEMEGERKLVA
ncbi:hypothetical protein E2562_024954 [Oryza meyeriana var. granulata]|uniref:Uncharacterized protein n=1 Tax=Oryza meyeriana var. granulata TaxID=110450 RepID=A0A6G1DN51_9ORYZ|nr:hypothetical protein E2562_024954 [Oryza meyeriana var. granulata]